MPIVCHPQAKQPFPNGNVKSLLLQVYLHIPCLLCLAITLLLSPELTVTIVDTSFVEGSDHTLTVQYSRFALTILLSNSISISPSRCSNDLQIIPSLPFTLFNVTSVCYALTDCQYVHLLYNRSFHNMTL